MTELTWRHFYPDGFIAESPHAPWWLRVFGPAWDGKFGTMIYNAPPLGAPPSGSVDGPGNFSTVSEAMEWLTALSAAELQTWFEEHQ
jgi:hypothetical protein